MATAIAWEMRKFARVHTNAMSDYQQAEYERPSLWLWITRIFRSSNASRQMAYAQYREAPRPLS